MTTHFKSPVTRCPKYLSHIRSKPCLVSGREGVQACHFRLGTDGALGMRPSDHFTVPLTPEEHRLQHDMGEAKYWLRAVNERPWILFDFMRDAMRWRHHDWEQSQ